MAVHLRPLSRQPWARVTTHCHQCSLSGVDAAPGPRPRPSRPQPLMRPRLSLLLLLPLLTAPTALANLFDLGSHTAGTSTDATRGFVSASGSSSSGAAAGQQQQDLLAGCPSWLTDYAAFHAANRGKPGAKYVLHTCYSGICGGAGDRLRGALWSARLAAATRRVLLVSWHRPAELTHWLRPAGAIDWTLEGLIEGVFGKEPWLTLGDLPGVASGGGGGGGGGFLRGTVSEGAVPVTRQHLVSIDQTPSEAVLAGLSAEAVVWQLEHNVMEDAPVAGVAGVPELSLWSDEAACVFRALFRPTALVTSATDAELVRMYGNTQASYNALHVRIGGLTGEGEASIGMQSMSKLTYFLEALDCLRNISSTDNNHNRNGAPQLVVSDSNVLRDKIAGGLLGRGLAAPSYTAAHLDTARGDVQLHATTFVSLELLARASCAVYTDSGFSRLAFYLGRKSCAAIFPRHDSSLPLLEGLLANRAHQQQMAAAAMQQGLAGGQQQHQGALAALCQNRMELQQHRGHRRI